MKILQELTVGKNIKREIIQGTTTRQNYLNANRLTCQNS